MTTCTPLRATDDVAKTGKLWELGPAETPAITFYQVSDPNRTYVTINIKKGTVEIGEGFSLDEAAQLFFDRVRAIAEEYAARKAVSA